MDSDWVSIKEDFYEDLCVYIRSFNHKTFSDECIRPLTKTTVDTELFNALETEYLAYKAKNPTDFHSFKSVVFGSRGNAVFGGTLILLFFDIDWEEQIEVPLNSTFLKTLVVWANRGPMQSFATLKAKRTVQQVNTETHLKYVPTGELPLGKWIMRLFRSLKPIEVQQADGTAETVNIKSPIKIPYGDEQELQEKIESSIIQKKIDGVRIIIVVEPVNEWFQISAYTRNRTKLEIGKEMFEFVEFVKTLYKPPFVLEFEAVTEDLNPSSLFAYIRRNGVINVNLYCFNIILLNQENKNDTYEQRWGYLKELFNRFIPWQNIFLIPEITVDNTEELLQHGKDNTPFEQDIEGIIFWLKKEIASERGGVYKYKFQFECLMNVVKATVTKDGEKLLAQCESVHEKPKITANVLLNGPKFLMHVLISRVKNEKANLGTVLNKPILVKHFGITKDHKLKSPTYSFENQNFTEF